MKVTMPQFISWFESFISLRTGTLSSTALDSAAFRCVWHNIADQYVFVEWEFWLNAQCCNMQNLTVGFCFVFFLLYINTSSLMHLATKMVRILWEVQKYPQMEYCIQNIMNNVSNWKLFIPKIKDDILTVAELCYACFNSLIKS